MLMTTMNIQLLIFLVVTKISFIAQYESLYYLGEILIKMSCVSSAIRFPYIISGNMWGKISQ